MSSIRGIEAGRAYVRTDADLTPLERKLKLIQGKFRAVGDSISSMGRRLATVGSGVAALGGAGLGALGWPLKLAANMEAAHAAFTTLLKDGTRAKTLLGDLEVFAKETPFGFEEVAEASKKLLAFGSTAENLKDELLSIGDVSSAIGAPLGEIAELYGKARIQGRLFMEDVNQLTGRGIPIIQELARQFGVADEEVRKLVESGRVNFGNLEQAFKDLTTGAGQFAGGMERQSRTLLGVFAALQDALQAAFRPFGDALMPAAKAALNIITAVTERFQAFAEANKQIAVGIGAAFVAATAIGAAVTVAGVALMGVGATVASVSTIMAAGFKAAGIALAVLANPLTIVAAGVAAIGYVAVEATGGIQKLSTMFGDLGTTATSTWAGIVAAISSGDVQAAGEVAFAGLDVAWQTLTTRMQEVWAGVARFFQDVWLNAVQSIISVGSGIYFGVADSFDRLSVALRNGFDTIGTYIVGLIDSIQTRIAITITQAMRLFRLLSAADAEGAVGILKSDAAGRAASRSSGLGQRMGDRASDLGARPAQRKKDAEDFGRTVAEDLARRRGAVGAVDQSGLTAAQKRLQELQVELARKAAEAQEASAERMNQLAQRAETVRGAAMGSMGSAGSTGTFVGAMASRIAGGGTRDSLTMASQQTAANTAQIANHLRDMKQQGGLQ